jgi:carbon monoxide dehydrogenase subunit G
MEINGNQTINAPRPAVWEALNDSDVLKRCLPGCESVERVSPEEFRIVMLAAVGPFRARFNGMLRMTEADAPKSCVMIFEGQGGAIGFGKGTSSVTLNESGHGTALSYSATAQIGGKLAQVGSRLIDSVARKMSDDFFTEFRKQFAVSQEATVAQASIEPAIETSKQSAIESPVVAVVGRRTARGAETATAGSHANLVPGSWLLVAAIAGAAIAIAGMQMVH